MRNGKEDRKAKILIVEDEAIISIDIARILDTLGYEILGAVASGEKVLEILEKNRPDLILMDIKLKGELDGIRTAEIINQKYQLPFIYLTTFADYSTLDRAKRTKPYGYVTKSYDRNSLHSTIEMALYRHMAEMRALEKEEYLALTLKSISDAVIGSTLEGTIHAWNKGACDIYGYREEEVRGKNISLLIPPFYPNEMPELLDQIMTGKNIDPYETIRQKKDGSIIHIAQTIYPLKGSDGTISGVTIFDRDITARKNLEKFILDASERERRRIGQDLHDSLGQHLTGISLKLKALSNVLKTKSYVQEASEAEVIETLVREAIMQTRELAKGLIPVTLNTEGFVHALKDLVYYNESISKVVINSNIDEDIVVNDITVATQLYHIAQEALNNSNKHGKASHISITLRKEGTELYLMIEDNGRGLANIRKEGLGFRIMQHRANLINARLIIYSPETGGTVVSCRVPQQKE